MYHMFNIQIAKLVGVDAAVFIHNIEFWIKKNLANREHLHDGLCWTYNSIPAYSVLFEYWSEKQIRTIIKNCIEAGLLVKGNYNEKSYDKTAWYALTLKAYDLMPWIDKNLLDPAYSLMCPNGQMDLPKRADGSAQMGRPIPDSIPTSNTNSTTREKEAESKPVQNNDAIDLPISSSAFIISEEIDRELLRFNQNFTLHAKDNREFLAWCKHCIERSIKTGTTTDRIRILKSWIRNGGLTKPKGFGDAMKSASLNDIASEEESLAREYALYTTAVIHDRDKLDILYQETEAKSFEDWKAAGKPKREKAQKMPGEQKAS